MDTAGRNHGNRTVHEVFTLNTPDETGSKDYSRECVSVGVVCM